MSPENRPTDDLRSRPSPAEALPEDPASASPQESEEARRLIAAVRAWASEPVEFTPLDVASLDLRLEPAPDRPASWDGRRLLPGPRLGWAMAAAALLFLAAWRAEFSLALGEKSIHWGRGPAIERARTIDARMSLLQSELASVRSSHQAYLDLLRLRDQTLEKEILATHNEFDRRLSQESKTRYTDFRTFLEIAGFTDTDYRAWLEQARGLPPGARLRMDERGVIDPSSTIPPHPQP
jgi:hypothetical protein